MCLGIRADVAVDNHVLILRELLQPGYGHLGGVQHVQFQLLLNNLKKEKKSKKSVRDESMVIFNYYTDGKWIKTIQGEKLRIIYSSMNY